MGVREGARLPRSTTVVTYPAGAARGVDDSRRVVSRLLRVMAAFCLSGLVTTPALGVCLPLPSPDLRAIDQQSDGDPARAIEQATARLGVADGAADRMRGAEIQAILAEANMQLSHPADVRQAVSAGLSLLDQLPASPQTQLLRSRLKISASDAALESADAATAKVILDKLLAGMQSDSVERSCALITRAQAYAQLNQPDLAASDALAAYRIADVGGWRSARVAAAYSLATVYRRAGLFTKAIAMIAEVIAAAKADRRESSLAVADFTLGRILIDAGRFGEAQEALLTSRELSGALHDRVGVAAADGAICMARIGLGDIPGAERACQLDESPLKEAHREDILFILQGVRSEIDIRRGRAEEAVTKLNGVLQPEGRQLIPYMLPRFYRDRSTANRELHRYQAAYSDLKAASDMERATNLAQRERAVAVLSAAAADEKLLADNHTLAERLAAQRRELQTQARIRRLWTWLEIGTLVTCCLLAYLALAMRRQSQALRRQETIMSTTASHAPDALLLLDARRRVRFSNRHLFGDATPHPVAEALGRGVPASVLPVLSRALDAVSSDRKPLTFEATIPDEGGQTQHFELSCVPVIEDDRLIGLTLRSLNVTERRRLEREVVDVAGRERQRLSGDLHEGLGQELTGVMLSLQSATRAMERGQPSGGDLVSEAVHQIAGCIEMTRDLARGLAPVHIHLGSLPHALERLASDAAARLKIHISTSFPQRDIPLSEAASDHLYRIVTEALTNAVRHGNCAAVHVGISSTEKALQLVIRDDGRGPPDDRGTCEGMGLKLMAYRARLLGGVMQFERGPSGGAQVTVSIPLPA